MKIGDKVHFSVSPYTHGNTQHMTEEEFYDTRHGTHVITAIKGDLFKTDKWPKWTNKFYFYKGKGI